MYNWTWFFKKKCLDIWVFSSSACGFMTGGLRNAGLTWFWPPWVHSPPSCRGSRRGSDTTSPWPACLSVRGQHRPFALQYGSLVMGPPRPRGFSQGGGIVWSNGHWLASLHLWPQHHGLLAGASRPAFQGDHRPLGTMFSQAFGEAPTGTVGLTPRGPEAEFLRTPPSLIGSVQMWAPASPWKWLFCCFFFFEMQHRGQTLSLSWSC